MRKLVELNILIESREARLYEILRGVNKMENSMNLRWE